MKLHESSLAGQTYCEAFEEKLHDERFQPESLAHVIFLAEYGQARNAQAESSKDVGTALGQYTVQTHQATLHVLGAFWWRRVASNRRRFDEHVAVSAVAPPPSLCRPVEGYADGFLREMLTEDNSLFEPRIQGTAALSRPAWQYCMEYEFLTASHTEENQANEQIELELSLLRKEVSAFRSIDSGPARQRRRCKKDQKVLCLCCGHSSDRVHIGHSAMWGCL